MRKITVILTLAFTFLTAALALAHGHGHVMGTITAVTADHLEVKTKEGKTVSIPLTPETKYVKGNQKVARTDAQVGARVVVHLAAGGAAAEVHLPATASKSAHSKHVA